MIRKMVISLGLCGILFAAFVVRYAVAQVPSGVLKKRNNASNQPKPEATDMTPKPLMYFDPDDPSKFPELVHRIPYEFRARHLPIIIGKSPSPSAAPESPINWR